MQARGVWGRRVIGVAGRQLSLQIRDHAAFEVIDALAIGTYAPTSAATAIPVGLTSTDRFALWDIDRGAHTGGVLSDICV